MSQRSKSYRSHYVTVMEYPHYTVSEASEVGLRRKQSKEEKVAEKEVEKDRNQ